MSLIRSTAACVIQQGERFLMVEEQRGGPQSVFNQPAGHIETGEGPITAILREVLEETAWQVSLTGYLGLYVFHTGDGQTFHSHGFVAEPLHQLGRAIDPEIFATHWLTVEQIRSLDQQSRLRSPLVLKRIEDALGGPCYPLAVIRE
ncbi:NUDIX domain-containing protein [Vreelandella boliviensis]|uniref:NUDIX domain-containing protein n=1 Tax=Vreelandella boliviensis LC1 TaxID=1072583 RepID=A0A265DWP6_9GAMM|nr:NUDIX domain-containing protein [Halomonas boliviensis]EHJ93137.1 Phosphatase nudJ [Halomonas boliviensis LC1]OZT73749.1 NUDIX domain-containing protein [Halomonas boliviensis LC1]